MKNERKSYLIAAGLLLGAAFTSSPGWAKDAVFDINYVDSIVEISPNHSTYAVNQHVVVTLHSDNRVTEARQWRAPSIGAGITVEGALGADASALKFTIKWRVESANSLIRYRTFPQHVEVMRISVSGQSCQVSIEHNLKPGFSTYERFGKSWEPHFYSSLSSSGISCTVAQ